MVTKDAAELLAMAMRTTGKMGSGKLAEIGGILEDAANIMEREGTGDPAALRQFSVDIDQAIVFCGA
jgi:hypothetical protein